VDMTKKGIERMTEMMSKAFWYSLERNLMKKDDEDGTKVTPEQKVLRALVILNYRVKDLEKKK
jgi:hypothetical protein